jgi:hypothetical protein
MTKLKENQFYCVKCKKIVTGSDICVKIYKTSTRRMLPALKAVHNKCDTNLTKFVSMDKKDKLIDKYGKC